MNQFFTKLKRLLGSPSPPPAETRPAETRPAETPSAETRPATVENALPPEPATTHAIPADDQESDDVSEVRALLDAVAAAPESAPVSETDAPLQEELELEPEPESVTRAPDEQAAEVPGPLEVATGEALILTLGTPPATFTVERSSATLGRGQENTIRLDDLSVSRRHARIAYRQGGYWLSDLGSMGGTWVNGTRLSAPRRVAASEVIDIGLCRLTVSFAGGSARAGAKKSASKRSEMASDAKRRR
jgi:hypothetical protein